MTLDSWNDLANALSVALIGVTFVVGLVALYTSREINKRQSAELVRLSTELAKAQTALSEQQERTAKIELEAAQQRERAATAEAALLQLQKAVQPRMIDPQVFARELKGRRKASAVDIVYNPNDHEAYLLAIQLRRWLGPGSGGDGLDWGASDVRPMTDKDRIGPLASKPNAPASLQSGVLFGGLALAVKKLEHELPNFFNPPADMEPVAALMFALQKAGIAAVSLMQVASFREGYIRIMIGQKLN